MIHQLLDTEEHMVGCRCLLHMVLCAPPSQNACVRIDEYLVNSWANECVCVRVIIVTVIMCTYKYNSIHTICIYIYIIFIYIYLQYR